jgi:hypothetical protein
MTGTTALSTASSGAAPTFGRVTTRGHFDVNWFGQTYRRDEYSKYEYDTAGTIPGYGTTESPESLCIFVHGWLQERDDVAKRFPKQRAALEQAGFDGPVVLFSWDSASSLPGWWVAAEYARQSGHKLGQFLKDYRAQNPATSVRVLGFSLGAMAAAPAGQSLYDRGWDGQIDSLALLGAALGDETLAAGGKYGLGCGNVFEEVDNYYKPDDQTLAYLFEAVEFNGAIGADGIQGTPNCNYEDHRVAYVDSHSSYWSYEDGCVEAVVDEWHSGGATTATSDDSASGCSWTSEIDFFDVSEDHWAYNRILQVARMGVVTGFPDGSFRPGETVTRGQLAAMLDQAYELDDGRESFDDTTGHWAQAQIERVAAAGFFSGYPGNEFRPDETTSRQQVLVALQGDPQFPSREPVEPAAVLDGLEDFEAIAGWAREGVARMAAHGALRNDEYLTHETGRQYVYPTRDATRAQVVNVLYNLLITAVDRDDTVGAAQI